MRPVLPAHTFLDAKTGAQLLRVDNLTEAIYWPGNPVMLVHQSTHQVLQGVVQSVEGDVVRIDMRTPAPRPVPSADRFMHRGWSIRRASRRTWQIYRKHDRSWSRGDLTQSTDGSCWVVGATDARTDFWAALDLAIDRIGEKPTT